MSSWEHLQSVLMQVQNRRIRAEFSDVTSDDDDDITTPRSSLRSACLLRDSDSATMTLLRMFLYYVMLEGAQAMHPPLYIMPTDRYQQMVKFAPQVTLYFKEDRSDVEDGFAPIDAVLSFRIEGFTELTMTPAEAHKLANKIRQEFATGNGYRWRKGRTKLSYTDRVKGYVLRVHAASEAEGREVIRKVLSIQNDTLRDEHLTINTLAETPSIVPPNQFVYGKTRRKPRKRPVGYVRFTWAEMHLHGVPDAIVLVDRSGRRRTALIAA